MEDDDWDGVLVDAQDMVYEDDEMLEKYTQFAKDRPDAVSQFWENVDDSVFLQAEAQMLREYSSLEKAPATVPVSAQIKTPGTTTAIVGIDTATAATSNTGTTTTTTTSSGSSSSSTTITTTTTTAATTTTTTTTTSTTNSGSSSSSTATTTTTTTITTTATTTTTTTAAAVAWTMPSTSAGYNTDNEDESTQCKVARYTDTQGFIGSNCPTQLATKLLSKKPIVRPKQAQVVPKEKPLQTGVIWPHQSSLDKHDGKTSERQSVQGRSSSIDWSKRPNSWPDKDKTWDEFVQYIGFPERWPDFIRESFKDSNFKTHNRMLAVHFASLNKVPWDLLDRVLMSQLRDYYFIKNRRQQVYDRYKSLHDGPNAKLNRSRAYSYDPGSRKMFYLDGREYFKKKQ